MRDNWPLLFILAVIVFMVGIAMDGEDIERPLNQHRTQWDVGSPP